MRGAVVQLSWRSEFARTTRGVTRSVSPSPSASKAWRPVPRTGVVSVGKNRPDPKLRAVRIRGNSSVGALPVGTSSKTARSRIPSSLASNSTASSERWSNAPTRFGESRKAAVPSFDQIVSGNSPALGLDRLARNRSASPSPSTSPAQIFVTTAFVGWTGRPAPPSTKTRSPITSTSR